MPLPKVAGASPREERAPYDSYADAAAERKPEKVADWTPPDVAQWLYTQVRRIFPILARRLRLPRSGGTVAHARDSHDVCVSQPTKEDCAHIFLIKNIDGPGLLSLSREQLMSWKLKAVDVHMILKGIETLKRLDAGRVGWSPGAFAPELIPAPEKPKEPKPPKGKPTKPRGASSGRAGAAKPQPTPRSKSAPRTTEPPEADDIVESALGESAAAPSDTQRFDAAADSSFLTATPHERPTGGGGSSVRGAHNTSGRDSKGESKQLGARSYLFTVRRPPPAPSLTSPPSPRQRPPSLSQPPSSLSVTGPTHTTWTHRAQVMNELHANERVPLWKEEMVERVKRRSTVRAEREAMSHSMSASAPTTARGLSTTRLPRSARGSVGVGGSSAKDGGSETSGVSSFQKGFGGSGMGGTVAEELGRELERKVYWYQDAIHDQELRAQLIEAEVKGVVDQTTELAAAREARAKESGMRVGSQRLEKEAQRKMMVEHSRLGKCLAVNEERVTDAHTVNRVHVGTINQLRRGRKDFIAQMRKMDEREASMTADMKHFATGSNAALDEKEKVEAKLKRQVFEYRHEVATWEETVQLLDAELRGLEQSIADAHAEEAAHLEKMRQRQYVSLKGARDAEQKREMRLGYLQNQVRGQEMDFQRLHRIMGVKFLPEKPESVGEIVAVSLKHEERNASLLAFVGVQNRLVEELHLELAKLDAEARRIEARRESASAEADASVVHAQRVSSTDSRLHDAIHTLQTQLETLCPAVEGLFHLLEASPPENDGGLLELKGFRPDTLPEYLKALDLVAKEVHTRALNLPSAQDNNRNPRLAGFTNPKVVDAHPSVFELRHELEVAAQKQAMAKPIEF